MIETQMQADAFAHYLVPRRRDSSPAVVDIYRLVLFVRIAQVQSRIRQRLHLEVYFTAARTRRYRSAIRIEKAGRRIQVTRAHHRAPERQWLDQSELVSVAIMAGLVRVEIVSAADDVTLAGRPRKLQHTTGRKFLFRIDAAEKEVALVRLGLKRRRQAQLQANRLEVLARARRVHGTVHSGGAMFIGDDDL